MGTFERYLGNRVSALLLVGVCTACGSTDLDNTEFTGGAAGVGDGGSSPGRGGSNQGGSDDAGTGGPCQVSFITPSPADGGSLTLGGGSDVDGTACGTEFSTSVLVSSNASQVTLFVNGASNSSLEQAVTNLTASFPAVQLGNLGATPNRLSARARMADGRTCETNLGMDLFVDCEGPSCSITRPAENVTFLNAADDVSAGDDTFHTTFEVETDDENAGQTVRLVVDDNLDAQLSAQVVDVSGQGVATFANIALDDAEHSARAECRDASGNVFNSPRAEWTVDTAPCVPTFTTTFPPTITPAADTVPGAAGIQLVAAGTILGAPAGDCAEIRVAQCDDLDGDFAELASSTNFSELATLPVQTGSTNLCARVRDQAGNVGDGQVALNVRVDAPQVLISSPANGAQFNVATDLTAGNGTCEVAFTVDCTDLNAEVEILEGGVVRDSEPCTQSGLVSPPYQGRATFAGVSLPTRNDVTDLSVTARQTVAGLIGTSAAIAVGSDCQAPSLSFTNSTQCGTIISLGGDDTVPGTPGLQFGVGVLHDGVPQVSLTVTRGGTAQPPVTEDAGVSSAQFTANLGGEGPVILVACATDPNGNQSCTDPCNLTVADVPTVTITTPLNAATLTAANDCAPSTPGLQITVSGTTDAVNNSPALITVGANATSSVQVSGNAFTACVAATIDGASQILTVAVTDVVKGLPAGTETITVNVDGVAPRQTIAAPGVGIITQRREGIVPFTWTSVADEGGGPLVAYQMRCGREPINSEGAWAAAAPRTVGLVGKVPQAGGNVESADVGGFRVGTTVFCAIRGQDLGGALTPMPLPVDPTTPVTIPFLEREYPIPNPIGAFAAVAALGDIDDDDQNDFVYSFNGDSARVFFGGLALDQTADVTISGVPGSLGAGAIGLGDINNDDRPDFAVTARTLNNGTANGGSVFVFFGRPNGTWPASFTLAARGGCGADLCFHSNFGSSNLGADVASGDFNGDGELDVVIGARTFNTATPGAAAGAGRVYVILGGAQLDVVSGTSIDLPGGNPNGFIIDSPVNTSNFGISLAAVGAGSDGRDDLVIGANGVTNSNPARVFFVPGEVYAGTGLISIAAAPAQIDSDPLFGEHGNPVRALGDFNGDGSGDVAVGSHVDLGGICEVFTREAAGFSASSSLSFTNDAPDDDWTTFIAMGFQPAFGTLGDLNRDGIGELAVGSLDTLPAGGSVDLFYGDVGVTAGRRVPADFHFTPAGQGRVLPNFVGDIDGDGFNDLAIIDYGANVTDKLTLLH